MTGLAPIPGKDARQAFEFTIQKTMRNSIMWTKPAYTDLRIGFEVTMYFANR